MKKVALICAFSFLALPSLAMLRRSPSPMPATAAARIKAEEQNRHPTLSPVFHRRKLSETHTAKETFPLQGNPHIMVVTYLTIGVDPERTYDTLVIDRNETVLDMRQLFRLTTFSHIESEVAHQAAEDWCNKMFPTMAYRLLESPPRIPRQITVMRADGTQLGLVDDEPNIAQRYRVIVESEDQEASPASGNHLEAPSTFTPPNTPHPRRLSKDGKDEKEDDDFT